MVKSHAGQKYTSDGVSIAIFKAICEKAGVPLQYFANRSFIAKQVGNVRDVASPVVIHKKKVFLLSLKVACLTAPD